MYKGTIYVKYIYIITCICSYFRPKLTNFEFAQHVKIFCRWNPLKKPIVFLTEIVIP